MNTLSQVYERVYDLMWERTTSTTYTIQSCVELINDYIDSICKGEVISLIDKRSYRAGNLSFLEKKIYYSNISHNSNSVKILPTDTEITVSCTSYPATGSVLVNGEIITYTGNTGTQLTGCTGITTTHESGSKVMVVYQLPTAITKPFQVFDTKTWYEIDYQDFRYNDMVRYYTVISQDWLDYIYFNNCGFNNMMVKYYLKPTILVYGVDDDVEITLPDTYGVKVVAPLVAGDMKYTKGEEVDLAMNNLNKWYTSLAEMYNYYSQKAKIYGKGIGIKYPGDPALWSRNLYNDKRDYINV